MWDRLLLAIDQFEPGGAALDFTKGLATAGQSVWVFHVRELTRFAGVPPLEAPVDAKFLVDSAVLSLHLAGISAEGRALNAQVESVARHIVEESRERKCDAIVLGSRRLRGLSRLAGWGVRENVLRLSPLPVLVAPTSLSVGWHIPKDWDVDPVHRTRGQ